MSTLNRLTRVTGALLGAAAGDALGWPQELRGRLVGGQSARDQLAPQPRYRAWVRNGGGHWGRSYKDPVERGEYSDDTQLQLATARSCLNGDEWLAWFSQVELPSWRIYQRGGGGAVLSAAAAWAEGRAPWIQGRGARSNDALKRYFQAGANGVAMRISPHVLSQQHDDELVKRVLRDGVTTHGHPRALVGGLVYAAAMATAVSIEGTLEYGELVEAARDGVTSFDEAAGWLPERWLMAAGPNIRDQWADTNVEMKDLLDIASKSLRQGALSNTDETLRLLGCIDSKNSGAGTVTAAGAIYLASRAAARPMSGLMSAAFAFKADTDTLASMTGGLLGAIHGTDWLGELIEVQDHNYIRSISKLLASREVVHFDPMVADRARRQRELHDNVLSFKNGSQGRFLDGRAYRIVEVTLLSDKTVARGALELSDGQTVYIDVVLPRNRSARATVPLFDTERAQAPSSQSVQANTQPARGWRATHGYVALESANFEACVDFYSLLLRQDIPIVDNNARVSDGLVLRRASSHSTGTDVELVIEVKRGLHEIGSSVAAEVVDGSRPYILTHDPDGRSIRLVESQG